jgi:hypothetical protein
MQSFVYTPKRSIMRRLPYTGLSEVRQVGAWSVWHASYARETAESAKVEVEPLTKSTDGVAIPEPWKHIFPPHMCQVLLIPFNAGHNRADSKEHTHAQEHDDKRGGHHR